MALKTKIEFKGRIFSGHWRCAYCCKFLDGTGIEAVLRCDNRPHELDYLFDKLETFCNDTCVRFHQVELEKL